MAIQPVQYLLARPGHMTPGKLAAQVAHAAVQAWRLEAKTSSDANVKRLWDLGGHYSKVLLATDDLWTAERYIMDRGFQSVLILDEGRTEFESDLTPTALGVEILDKNDPHVRETFGTFKLFKQPPIKQPVVIELAARIKPETLESIKRMVQNGWSAEDIKRWHGEEIFQPKKESPSERFMRRFFGGT